MKPCSFLNENTKTKSKRVEPSSRNHFQQISATTKRDAFGEWPRQFFKKKQTKNQNKKKLGKTKTPIEPETETNGKTERKTTR